MPDMPDGFVTVSEAAAVLGLDPRQVRRYLPRLEAKDKGQDTQRTHKGQPIVLVRLSAVEALREGELRGEAKGHPRDKGQDSPSFVSDLLAEKDARIRDLVTALELERESHKRAELLHLNTQGELSALRERAAQLEKLNTRLIEALPSGNTDTPAGSQNDTDSVPSGVGRVETPSNSSEGKIKPLGRRWWQVWKR